MLEDIVRVKDRSIIIREPKTIDDYKKLMDVQIEIWGMPDYSEAVTYHMLISAHRHGGVLYGAFEEDTGRAIGLVFSIPAYRNGKIYQYSHLAGVIPEYRHKGLGYILKLKQRKHVINQGLDLIVWTYDPLQGSNAKFNIEKLGAIVRKFYENYYGELLDKINIGMPSDRFEAEWYIKSKRVELKLRGLLKTPSLDKILEIGGYLVTSTHLSGEVRVLKDYNLTDKHDLVIVEIPGELKKLKKHREILLAWRYKARTIFNYYLSRGYIVIEFITQVSDGERRNFYILWRRDLEDILRGAVPWS
mgnify:CR=1 FL=1